MLSVCKSEPQYVYKRYAYKKKHVLSVHHSSIQLTPKTVPLRGFPDSNKSRQQSITFKARTLNAYSLESDCLAAERRS